MHNDLIIATKGLLYYLHHGTAQPD